jgi:vitamin B12 transporter
LFLFDRKWEQRFGVNLSQTNRQSWYTDQSAALNIATTYAAPTNNQGQQVKVEWINFIHITDFDTVTAGIDGKFNSMTSTNEAFNGSPSATAQGTMSNGGYYLQNEITWLDRFHTTLGGRLDTNSLFSNHLTWRANQVIGIPELDNRIKANIGTAFKAPSLCELTPNCYGNPNLQPETSLDWDVGIEQDLFERKMTIGALYFRNNFNNLIQYTPNAPNPYFPGYGNVVNVQSAMSEGIESFWEYKPMSELSLRLNYTYDQTQGYYDQTNGIQTNQPLLLRPKNKGNFDLDYRFLEKASAHVNILAFGSRSSYDNNGNIAQVAGYVLVNLSANYELNEQITLFGRMDNVLNKTYQQVWGYGTMGFTGIGGFNLKL